MDICSFVNKPRRVLGGMKEREIQEVCLETAGIENEARNRLNGYGSEPDGELFAKYGVAIVIGLMVRAIRRNRIESEGRGSYPGRPKPAARRRGENMSRARGAEN